MDASPLWPNESNLAYIEELLDAFRRDPQSVSPQWRSYFETMLRNDAAAARFRAAPAFDSGSLFRPTGANGHSHNGRDGIADAEALQDRIDQMVRAYRVRGHMLAQLDPLGLPRGGDHPELEPEYYGFEPRHMDQRFSSRTIAGAQTRTLREIISLLRNTYSRFIGVQFMHIDELQVRHWLQERMEGTENRLPLARRDQFRILTRLTDASIFEEFIQKKFKGEKSFSLEGGESLIPLLDMAIEKAAEQSVDEVVIAMAHRGRLNVLANILGKHPRRIFREFADFDALQYVGRGDVKYHLGYSNRWKARNGRELYLSLCFNPSHLEYVNPIALGRTRACQDRSHDAERRRSMTLMIHGDAAFAGEGIIQETLNLSELAGYRVGGALHVVVNNQIGFTTDAAESRSCIYATDVAKMLQAPIFHVNGEVPEAVAQVVKLAMEFRDTFQRDVFIDMYCYRRHGHNETDEPRFTQPLMYKAIDARQNVRRSYLENLLELGGITRDEAEEIETRLREHLEQELSSSQDAQPPAEDISPVGKLWTRYKGGLEKDTPDVDTGVPAARLRDLLASLASTPPGFTPHPTMQKKLLVDRAKMASGERELDWSGGELLAFASLAVDGVPVRLTGQDSQRGTFSHRHAVLHDVNTGARHYSLQNLAPKQAPVEIHNSPLSEAGVMGFEYGYSLGQPDGLVIWEAQFGDFVNVAQVIIDQFLSSAEEKWNRLSGLVLLLPHGFEGQGPEHSSARLERFLSLLADDNMQVAYPTTPAQIFHLLRRQVMRPWRKPLVVMTPKSLLRHPRATSTLQELTRGTYRPLIADPQVPVAGAERVILCSGKVYYDLLEYREEHFGQAEGKNGHSPKSNLSGDGGQDDGNKGDGGKKGAAKGASAAAASDAARKPISAAPAVPIIRLEQLYPLRESLLRDLLAPAAKDAPVVWVQEEPENMGAWNFLHSRWGETLFGRPLINISRPASASPATGSKNSHKLEQKQLLERAFGPLSIPSGDRPSADREKGTTAARAPAASKPKPAKTAAK